MNARRTFVGFVVTGCLVVSTAVLLPTVGWSQDVKVENAMELLRRNAAKLGPPKIEGTDTVASKPVPALYFGSTKINNTVDLVDSVTMQASGSGLVAASEVNVTIFVKSGEEYVRVSTNVKKDDGTRAIGTTLDPKGKVIESIKKNEPFYGNVDVLGKPYVTGYEPIHDESDDVIGIYYVGYQK